MLPTLALAALCASILPSSLALPFAYPSPLDLANWRSLPPSLTLYNATLPTHPEAHVHIVPPPPPPAAVKRAADPATYNPKVVKNPKHPDFSSSLILAVGSKTSTHAAAALPSSSAASSSAQSSSVAQTTRAARTDKTTTTVALTTNTTTTAAQASATGKVYSGGWATYYYQGGNPGNCGWYMQDTDYIVALPTKTYARGTHCGKYVRVTRVSDGASVKAMVADSCPTCENNESIDMSYAAFTSIATEEEGMVAVTWQFI